eukprot:469447_1
MKASRILWLLFIVVLISYAIILLYMSTRLAENISTTNGCPSSVYKIFRHHCCYDQFAIKYLKSLGFTSFDYNISNKIDIRFKSTILWNKGNNIDNKFACKGLNIQQRNYLLANPIPIQHKTKIHSLTMKYCNKHKIQNKCNLFFPQTYNLNNQNERIEFFKQIKCNNEPNNEWIIKGNDHRGKGIKFIQNSNFLRKFYLTKQEQISSNCIIDDNSINNNQYETFKHELNKNVVAQQLILNTLKIDNCSFHIRTFFFVA